jgi:hypothetical protein
MSVYYFEECILILRNPELVIKSNPLSENLACRLVICFQMVDIPEAIFS